MTEEDDIDALAAEYVLGSLDAVERAEVEVRRMADASLDRAIEAWERRLGPLSEREPGVEPPGHLYGRILERIAAQRGGAGHSAEIIPLRPRSRRWRMSKVGAGGALAACLALAIAWFTYLHVGAPAPTPHTTMDCGGLYKDYWQRFDRQTLTRISGDQLANASRLALRAYDACAAGDEQNAKAQFEKLRRMQF